MDWDAEMDDLRSKSDEFFRRLNRDGASCCQLRRAVNEIVHLSIDMARCCRRGTPGCDVAHEHNRHWECD